MAPRTPQRPTNANANAHTREQSPPSPLPFQRTGTTQGTVPIPPVANPAGTPAFQAVITKLEQMEREATLRRATLEGYAKAMEAFVRNSPDEQKKLAQEIQEGTLALSEPPPFRDRCCEAAVQNFLRGGPQNPEHDSSGRGPVTTGAQTVRPPTAGNPTLKSQRERTDLRIYARAEPGTLLVRDQPFLIREAITKAVPQISAKDIPRLWATPTGWAVKPNTKAVYDLILKGIERCPYMQSHPLYRSGTSRKMDTHTAWPTPPNVLTGLLDNRLVTADIVSKEAEIQTRVKPVNCHSAGTSGPTSVWFISFKEEGALGAACSTPPKCAGCHGPFPAGHKHCAAAPKRVDGKIIRLTVSQLGEIRRQQTATRRACELAAKRRQEQRPEDGVQVVIPTPGARVAAHEEAAQQPRRVKRKTAPTGSLNLAELSETKRIRSVRRRSELDSYILGRKTHETQNPAYECYAPVDSWEQALPPEREAERPRAMSYTRKAASLATQQRRNGNDRDIVWLEVPSDFLIGGDFNAKHDMFEPGVESSNQGASLAAWSLNSGADFIGGPGEPTHRAGHTIDLTFSNIPFAETMVRHDLDCGSDHFTLVTLLPGRGQGADGNTQASGSQRPTYRSLRAPSTLESRTCRGRPTRTQLKQWGSRHRAKPDQRHGGTPACANLHASYARARRRSEPDQETKRRKMLSTIRNAKRDYWRRVIDGAANDVDLYKIVGWHKLAPSLKAPPLIVDGVSIESTKEKAEALLEKVLHQYNSSDDLDYDPLEAEGRRPNTPVDNDYLA
ncbi:hypothetical protein DID88_000763 [Monilinia fructigena]|uniref:Endonuclease/exonuclease/phosphatase domain-containing protein n=1 Tax=Monilinia fructigena TaxID=38457 RepID=A0A395IKT8_9HELO|nr:hypothetical protein DID88_000763 [Monilinia fructigena]